MSDVKVIDLIVFMAQRIITIAKPNIRQGSSQWYDDIKYAV